MRANLTFGFITASLVQAGIIMFGEYERITALDAKMTSFQLFTHIIVGLVAGYILYYIIKKIPSIRKIHSFYIGTIYGIILWPIVLGIASTQDKVNSPLLINTTTVLWTLIAFILYGVIVTYSIYSYGYERT